MTSSSYLLELSRRFISVLILLALLIFAFPYALEYGGYPGLLVAAVAGQNLFLGMVLAALGFVGILMIPLHFGSILQTTLNAIYRIVRLLF